MSYVHDGELEASDTALLETLVLEAPVAFAFYDAQLRYRRINRMLADINGVPMRDHIGKRPTEVLEEPLASAVEARLQQVFDTGAVISDDDIVAAAPDTGELRHYESKWFPATGEDGSVTGVAVLVIDVTERHRNEEALRRSTERTARLQLATAALAGALTVDEVQRVMTEVATKSLGATGVRLLYGTSVGQPDDEDDPAVAALPLLVSGGQIGVLLLRFPEPVSTQEATFLSALAGQCAIALERARLYERERATAVTLQHDLLPAVLPDVPGIELAASFRAGAADAEVGGDWYDVFSLPDGRVVLVVGDVMGKGVPAAAGMGRLRSALRALAHANPLPEAVLQGLDRVFTATEASDQIATLVYLLVNPTARRVAVGGAGHLPLLLRRAGGEAELVDAGSGSTPLGWPEPRHQRTLELGEGDVILAFTDGLVERRGADIDVGLDELRAGVRGSDEPLVSLVERLSASLMESTLGRDDATMLAVRFIA